jgi:hypothetical protein
MFKGLRSLRSFTWALVLSNGERCQRGHTRVDGGPVVGEPIDSTETTTLLSNYMVIFWKGEGCVLKSPG